MAGHVEPVPRLGLRVPGQQVSLMPAPVGSWLSACPGSLSGPPSPAHLQAGTVRSLVPPLVEPAGLPQDLCSIFPSLDVRGPAVHLVTAGGQVLAPGSCREVGWAGPSSPTCHCPPAPGLPALEKRAQEAGIPRQRGPWTWHHHVTVPGAREAAVGIPRGQEEGQDPGPQLASCVHGPFQLPQAARGSLLWPLFSGLHKPRGPA